MAPENGRTLWPAEQTQVELGGISRRTLHNFTHRSDNPLPHLKLGSRLMFDPVDVRAWIEQQKKRGQ